MTDAPERIWARTEVRTRICGSAREVNIRQTWCEEYGVPKIAEACGATEYIRADLARPVTVAEAAKVLLDAKYTSIRLAFDAMETAMAESEGVERILESGLRALSHEGGE